MNGLLLCIQVTLSIMFNVMLFCFKSYLCCFMQSVYYSVVFIRGFCVFFFYFIRSDVDEHYYGSCKTKTGGAGKVKKMSGNLQKVMKIKGTILSGEICILTSWQWAGTVTKC